jgi:flagellar protein FlgJ
MTKIEFINKMNTACTEAAAKNAIFNKAVIYAQAALESNWGSSELAKKANNLFSIKAGVTWVGATIMFTTFEWSNLYGWHQTRDNWRKYANWTDCIVDYANIINKVSWFKDALQYLDQPQQFLKALLSDGTNPGWATDPQYFKKVSQIAKELENYGGPKWN